MVVIGIDAHKASHTAAAVQEATGKDVAQRTVSARAAGYGTLLEWGRALAADRVWAIEDCRHVSGGLERFLLGRGERIIRVPPKLMAGARQSARSAGKSDEIDARAVARAAAREGIESFAAVCLDDQALEIRQLVDHRERLIHQRTALINDLRWQLHDIDPDLQVPLRQLTHAGWQQKTARKLSQLTATGRVRVARDELRRVRELTRAVDALYRDLDRLVRAYRPGLLNLHGCGVLSAAKAIGETGGAQRFSTAAKFARLAGVAPLPASSGSHQRHRLDRGGNRQLNAVLHRIAITQLRSYAPARAYYLNKIEHGKRPKEALRALKRQIANRLWALLQPNPDIVRSRHLIPVAIHCNTPIP